MKVCVTFPNRDFAYSETFIRAHVERLPAEVETLYGDWFPLFYRGANGARSVVPRWLSGVCLLTRRLPSGDALAARFERSALARVLRARGVDAVLAEYGLGGVGLMEACAAAGVPLIVHFHGWDAYDETPLRGPGKQYPRLFELCSAIIAVSRDMERQLLDLGAPREKLHYNPYGVDTASFGGADPGAAQPLFVAVGRFVDKKAPHLTILAFERVLRRHPEARLVMVGDGALWEASKQLVRALRIGDGVEFLGPRSHEEIAGLMRRARAFVQHSVRASYGDSEGTPVAVLEAGASGLPVVSTRHAGINDVVLHEETGLLVDEGDVAGMAEQMTRLVEDPALARSLGQAAAKRIAEKFRMEDSIGNLWKIIADAVASGGAR